MICTKCAMDSWQGNTIRHLCKCKADTEKVYMGNDMQSSNLDVTGMKDNQL